MPSRRQATAIPIDRRITLFERVYSDLKANPYSQAVDVSIKFAVYADHNEVSINLEDPYVWEAYLTRFRQLINADEPVSLDRILRILPRYIDDRGLRQRLRAARRALQAAEGLPSVGTIK